MAFGSHNSANFIGQRLLTAKSYCGLQTSILIYVIEIIIFTRQHLCDEWLLRDLFIFFFQISMACYWYLYLMFVWILSGFPLSCWQGISERTSNSKGGSYSKFYCSSNNCPLFRPKEGYSWESKANYWCSRCFWSQHIMLASRLPWLAFFLCISTYISFWGFYIHRYICRKHGWCHLLFVPMRSGGVNLQSQSTGNQPGFFRILH